MNSPAREVIDRFGEERNSRLKPHAGPAFSEAKLQWLCIALYATLVLWIVSRPLVWLLGYVADDAFYYLQIARHLAQSGLSTFDGVNPTNGYHPGWMLILTLMAKVIPTRIMLLRAMLFVTLLIHASGAWTMKKILERYLRPIPALAIAAGWLFNPFALRIALCGTEGPLTTAMALLVLWLYLRLSRAEAPSMRRCALLGVVLGAAVLARTDQLLLALLVLLHLGLGAREGRLQMTAMSVRRALIAVACAAAVVAPWLLFSYLSVGTIQQDSGVMKQLWLDHETARRSISDGLALMWIGPILTGLMGSSNSWTLDAWVSLVVMMLGMISALVACGYRKWPPFRALAFWLLTYALLLGAIYVWRFSDLQMWHLATSAAALWMVLCGAAALAWEAMDLSPRRWAFAVVLVGIILAPILRTPLEKSSYPSQRTVFANTPVLQRRVPEGEPIGCLDAGIPAYFSRRRVVNLDGLVNHAIVPYWRRGKVDAYLQENGIQYIIVGSFSFARMLSFCRHDARFTQIATVSRRARPHYPIQLWRFESGAAH